MKLSTLLTLPLATLLFACGDGSTLTSADLASASSTDAAEPVFSIDAAREVATSHCDHLQGCAEFYGITTPEDTCIADEMSVLEKRPLLCNELELYECEAKNRPPTCEDTYPTPFVGGYCAKCFGPEVKGTGGETQ